MSGNQHFTNPRNRREQRQKAATMDRAERQAAKREHKPPSDPDACPQCGDIRDAPWADCASCGYVDGP